MDTISIQKPCVVETPQGFSVSYNNQLLYSKYNPKKAILQIIGELELLPGTIILCNSPVLGYGLAELKLRLPENCILILCEADLNLYHFAKEHISITNEIFPSPQELYNLPLTVFNLSQKGKFRRILSIDFSAGSSLHKNLYAQLNQACTASIMTFWKNRVTLTRFGRKYSHNLYTNLKHLSDTTPITSFYSKITKPILVFGAGQSVDLFFQNHSITAENYFILCADTALLPLQARNIKPQGVFIEEAQNVISKAFIGINQESQVYAGLSSLPALQRYIKPENLSYFTTAYSTGNFLENLKSLKIIPPSNEPFGSVGLTTVYYALKFRKDTSIPVYFAGLDFSYSSGITHAKNTIAHKERIINNYRFNSIQNYNAAFNSNSLKIADKKNNLFFTSPSLQSYAQLFNNYFEGTINLFDMSECGIPLNIPFKLPEETKVVQDSISKEKYSQEQKNELNLFLCNEKAELIKLKNILTGEEKLSEEERKQEIIKITTSKEYLFLHFADGYCFEYNQSFLNRIRTEIDFFLKCF